VCAAGRTGRRQPGCSLRRSHQLAAERDGNDRKQEAHVLIRCLLCHDRAKQRGIRAAPRWPDHQARLSLPCLWPGSGSLLSARRRHITASWQVTARQCRPGQAEPSCASRWRASCRPWLCDLVVFTLRWSFAAKARLWPGPPRVEHHRAPERVRGQPGGGPFTRQELQRFLDYADDQVDRAAWARRKGALAAYRDATLFKVIYGWERRVLLNCMADPTCYSSEEWLSPILGCDPAAIAWTACEFNVNPRRGAPTANTPRHSEQDDLRPATRRQPKRAARAESVGATSPDRPVAVGDRPGYAVSSSPTAASQVPSATIAMSFAGRRWPARTARLDVVAARCALDADRPAAER
jgi:hypothetical protein